MTRLRISVVTALIEKDGDAGGEGGRCFLLTQRRPEAVLPLLWEFPGGRVQDGEDDALALRRELMERMAVDARIGDLALHVTHSYTGYDLDLKVYRATLAPDARPRSVRVHDIRWVPEEDLPNFQFPGADQQTVDALLSGD